MDLVINGIAVPISGLTPEHLEEIHQRLKTLLSDPHVKNREAIAEAFAYGISIASEVNPSDLWHHVIYREFVNAARQVTTVNNPGQSWVRSSGDAFELFLQNYYNSRLAKHG